MGHETDRIRLKLAHRKWDARRVAVTLVGVCVLLLGIVLMALPGPGTLVVVLGFAILATEYVWAWRAKRYLQRKARAAGTRVLNRRPNGAGRDRQREEAQ